MMTLDFHGTKSPATQARYEPSFIGPLKSYRNKLRISSHMIFSSSMGSVRRNYFPRLTVIARFLHLTG